MNYSLPISDCLNNGIADMQFANRLDNIKIFKNILQQQRQKTRTAEENECKCIRRIRWIAVNCTDGGTDAIRQYTAHAFLNYGFFFSFFIIILYAMYVRTMINMNRLFDLQVTLQCSIPRSLCAYTLYSNSNSMQMIALNFVLQFSLILFLKKVISVIVTSFSSLNRMQHFDCENKLNEYKTKQNRVINDVNDSFFFGWSI